jgi:hypothetical protein
VAIHVALGGSLDTFHHRDQPHQVVVFEQGQHALDESAFSPEAGNLSDFPLFSVLIIDGKSDPTPVTHLEANSIGACARLCDVVFLKSTSPLQQIPTLHFFH